MSQPKLVKAKTKMLTLRITADQLRLIDQKADRCGVRRSHYLRSIVLQAARSTAAQGYLRIREPEGMIA
jgi:uncharacterized protein (DUF1778 family)